MGYGPVDNLLCEYSFLMCVQCSMSITIMFIFTVLGGIIIAVIITVAVIVAVIACTRLKRRRKTEAHPV